MIIGVIIGVIIKAQTTIKPRIKMNSPAIDDDTIVAAESRRFFQNEDEAERPVTYC